MTEINCDLISIAQKINLCLSFKHSNPPLFITNSLLVIKEINETISKIKEPDKLLKEIPNVFTLCETLVENPSYGSCDKLGEDSLSSALSKFLFRCLASFDKASKQHREKYEWSMKNIRKLLLPLNVYSICQIGFDRKILERIHSEQVSKSVCHKTKELNVVNETNIHRREGELKQYKDIVQNLIDLSDLSDIRVWESAIKAIGGFPTELRLRLCSCISEKLTGCSKVIEKELPLSITEMMYLICRPLMERDLLQLFSDCSHLVLPSSLVNKLQNSYLVPVCSRNTTLLHACIEMLHSLLLRAWSSEVLRFFINSFCKCTQRNEDDRWEQGLAILKSMYVEYLHPLSKHLQGFLNSRGETTKAGHVKAISREVQKLEEYGTTIQRGRMYLLLVHHLDVYSRVIEFCLTCDKELITDCLEIIAVYHYSSLEEAKQKHVTVFYLFATQSLRNKVPDSSSLAISQQFMTAFPSAIECLRGLLHKVSLGIMDVRCAVVHISDVVHDSLKGKLLIAFLLKSEQGLKHAPDILQMAVGSNLAHHQLKALLTVHDSLDIEIDRWSAAKQNQYRTLLHSLSRGINTTELPSTELITAVNSIVERMS